MRNPQFSVSGKRSITENPSPHPEALSSLDVLVVVDGISLNALTTLSPYWILRRTQHASTGVTSMLGYVTVISSAGFGVFFDVSLNNGKQTNNLPVI